MIPLIGDNEMRITLKGIFPFLLRVFHMPPNFLSLR